MPLHPESRDKLVVLRNQASLPRLQWTHVPVPFAQGELPAKGPALWSLGDLPTVWQPFGARWPDGSARQAFAFARVKLAPSQQLPMAVKAIQQAPEVAPFQFARGFQERVAALRFELTAVVEGTPRTVGLTPRRLLEANAARQVTLHVARIPGTMLVVECVLATYADQELVPFDLAVYCSDPTSPAMSQAVDQLLLTVRGAVPVVRYWMVRGLQPGPRPDQADAACLQLLPQTQIDDGQGQRWAGSLLFEPPADAPDVDARRQSLAAETQAPLLQAAVWKGSANFGPFGIVPAAPPWLQDGGRSYLQRRHAEFQKQLHQKGDPWAGTKLGMLKSPGATGDQSDFGVIKGWPVALTGSPTFLLEMELAALQEACRPNHFFEADGEPVEAEKHPGWIVWSGRTHWHPEASTDRLGKPAPEPKTGFQGWFGKDNQHWSSLYLCGFHLLSGSFGALREIENEARLFLASQRLKPGEAGAGPDAPRAVGRTLLSGCWIYLCTGDERIRQRLIDRVEQVVAKAWAGRGLDGKPVRPVGKDGPDGRILDGKTVAWQPWQEGLAVLGLAAVHALTGNDTALQIAQAACRSLCLHGTQLRPDGSVQVAKDVRWKDGDTLTPEELLDKAKVHVTWADGTDFVVWCVPAFRLGHKWAVELNDSEWQARSEDILRRALRRRVAPGDGGFDRFGEWDAVV
jgi:hypothetical protein